MLDMAHYEPSETEPMYRHTRIQGLPTTCSNTDCSRMIQFLAKLQFVPVVAESDPVQIDNLAALKLMIRAVRLEENGDDDGAVKCQALAIKELNRQLANKMPLDQIPVEVSSSGTALPANRRIGLIQ